MRIHIEKDTGLLKNRYAILQVILPLRLLKSIKDEAVSATSANCDKIVTACAAPKYLGESIVQNKLKICYIDDSVCLILFRSMFYLRRNQIAK